jgi:hypothetical protein
MDWYLASDVSGNLLPPYLGYKQSVPAKLHDYTYDTTTPFTFAFPDPKPQFLWQSLYGTRGSVTCLDTKCTAVPHCLLASHAHRFHSYNVSPHAIYLDWNFPWLSSVSRQNAQGTIPIGVRSSSGQQWRHSANVIPLHNREDLQQSAITALSGSVLRLHFQAKVLPNGLITTRMPRPFSSWSPWYEHAEPSATTTKPTYIRPLPVKVCKTRIHIPDMRFACRNGFTYHGKWVYPLISAISFFG